MPLALTAVCGTGQVQQSDQQPAIRGAADEHEDKDGDVVMADEDVEQLVASLQAARHAGSEWESVGGPSSISMLLFGHQVKHLYCCQRLHMVVIPALLACLNTCTKQESQIYMNKYRFTSAYFCNNCSGFSGRKAYYFVP